jgi:hypothetical protein
LKGPADSRGFDTMFGKKKETITPKDNVVEAMKKGFE